MNYQGSCHCGAITFQAEGTIEGALACNCSICQRLGSLLWFVPRDRFTLLTPESAVSTYTFNTHRIKHRHCAVCGIHPYAEATDPKGNAMVAVNIRCLDGIELDAIPVQHYDGRAL